MRPTYTYGRLLFDQSQQAKEYFIEKAITSMLSNVPELAFDGYGESARQWLYFPDHVSAYTTVLEKSEPQPLEIYNVAGPETKTLKEVITTLQQLTGWNRKVKWGLNSHPIDPNHLTVDTQKLYTLLWRPLYDLQKGLSNYLERLNISKRYFAQTLICLLIEFQLLLREKFICFSLLLKMYEALYLCACASNTSSDTNHA